VVGPKPTLKGALDVLTSIALIAASVAVVRVAFHLVPVESDRPVQDAKVPSRPIELAGAPAIGVATAKVGVVEFSDFQCPYCAKVVNETLPQLKSKYVSPGKVVLVFRHFPLEAIHPFAKRAAEVAECAAQQGKFWDFHDLVFRNQPMLSDGSLDDWTQRVGIANDKLKTCTAGAGPAKVKQDIAEAQLLGIAGTPTFFIGRIEKGAVNAVSRLDGAAALNRFEAAIDPLLEKR